MKKVSFLAISATISKETISNICSPSSIRWAHSSYTFWRVRGVSSGVYYPKFVQLGPIKDREYITRFDEVVQNTTQIYWPDDELANIVWECLGPYFAGDRTMEDTVRMLDSVTGFSAA